MNDSVEGIQCLSRCQLPDLGNTEQKQTMTFPKNLILRGVVIGWRPDWEF